MKDRGQAFAEAELKRVKGRLREIFQQAAEENLARTKAFERAHAERVRKYREKVNNGEITEADFQAWMQGQIFQREQWQQLQDQIAWSMVHADEMAAEMLRDNCVDIFCENANYSGYEAEDGGRRNVNFGLYNREAVARLVVEDPDLLPRPTVDKGRDYDWYNRKLSNVITQGILQGQDLDRMMLNLANETGEQGMNAMYRNARTAYGGAMNAGIAASGKQLKALGVKTKLRWNCRMLPTSRDWHAELDGEEIDPDETFDTALGPMKYPRDPSGEPANVYNCHCYLTRVFPDFSEGSRLQRDTGTGEIVPKMTYEQWKARKAASGATADAPRQARQNNTPGMEDGEDVSEGVRQAAKNFEQWRKQRQKAKRTTANAASADFTGFRVSGPDSDLQPGEKYRFTSDGGWEVVRETENGLEVVRKGTLKDTGENGTLTVQELQKTEESLAHIEVPAVKQYYGDIQTDVYMSDERKNHIREHHPDDYDDYIGYVASTIKNPMIILDDHRSSNTAMFIGETAKDNINVVVKLAFTKEKDNRSFTVTVHPAGEKTMKKFKKKYREVYRRPKQ